MPPSMPCSRRLDLIRLPEPLFSQSFDVLAGFNPAAAALLNAQNCCGNLHQMAALATTLAARCPPQVGAITRGKADLLPDLPGSQHDRACAAAASAGRREQLFGAITAIV